MPASACHDVNDTLLKSCSRLSDSGIGVFSGAPHSLIGGGLSSSLLDRAGLGFEACILASREAEPKSPVCTGLLFIGRGEAKPVFVGELSANTDHNSALLTNLVKRRPDATWRRGCFMSPSQLEEMVEKQALQHNQPLHQPIDGDSAAALLESLASANREPRHSPDFRSVNWFGDVYEFTSSQAVCMSALWQCWTNGTPTIGEHELRGMAGLDQGRLRDVFKGKGCGNHAWL